MKIGILSVFPPFRGGIAQFNACLSSALNQEAVEVVEFNFSRQYPSLLFPGKTQFVEGKSREDVQGTLDSINPFSWKRTADEIQNSGVEVLIIPFWTGFLGPALTSVMKRLKGIRVIGLMHNGIPHDAGSFQVKMTRKFIELCDAYVTLSKDVTDTILPFAAAKPITTLFHPVYDHFGDLIPKDASRSELEIPSDKKVLLFFGLVRPYKGLIDLIEAFKGLDDTYFLLIAGEAYDNKEKYLKALNAADSERWHWTERYLEDAELPAYFGAADLVVLPYREASQSGVTAAAMHFLKPVVASDVGGLKEYIHDEKTGYLSEPNHVTSLRETIEKASNTDWSISDLEKNRDRFGWKRFAQELIDSFTS